MKDIADDLIDDLEDLENTTQELDEQVDQVVKNNATLDKYAGETAIETAVLMLEASKLAQESAISSQESASINLKLAGQQQQQIDSMHDAGISWRQTIRDANLEIKSSRGFFVGLLTSGIILSLIAIGLMGWLVLMSKSNQAESQSKLIDMIQTEASLNQRQVNMKIDELASVVENALSYQPVNIANSREKTTQSPSLQLDEIQQTITRSLAEYKAALSDFAKVEPIHAEGIKTDIKPLTNQLSKIENLLQAQSTQIESLNKSLQHSTRLNTQNDKTTSSVKNTHDILTQQLSEMKKQLDALQARQNDIHANLQKLANEVAKTKEEAANEGPKPYSYRNPYEYKQ